MENKHIEKCLDTVLHLLIVSLRPRPAKPETETLQDVSAFVNLYIFLGKLSLSIVK